MRKNIIFTLYVVCTFMLVLSSCSKDSDTEDHKQEVEDVEAAKKREDMKTEGIMQSLCEIIEHKDGSIEYQPRIGAAIYDVSPTIYYTTAESLEEAEGRYYNIIGALNSSLDQQIRDKEITQGDIHLKFEKGSSSEIARIKIDCPRLKDILTEIVFIPSNKWPENDLASPFLVMSIWKQISTNRIYVCVRKSQGSKGIMLTFDGGWSDDWFRYYNYWQGSFYLWENTAQPEDFNALAGAMKYSPSKFSNMFSKLEQYDCTTMKIIKTLYKELSPSRSVTFDNSYRYDHHLWWFHYCYDVTIYKTTFYYDYTCSSWSVYYTHRETPRRSTASHSFYFTPEFKSNKDWECLYRGAS